MAKRGRGRPKGSLNKKTLEKQKVSTIDDQMAEVNEMIEQLDEGSNGIKEEDFGYDGNGSPVIEPIEKGSIKEKVLAGPDTEHDESDDLEQAKRVAEKPKKSSAPKKWTADTLPRNPSVVEILKGVNSLRGKKDQIAQLSQFTGRADVVYCLKAAFDDRVQFTLPDGLPDNFVIGDPDTPAGAMDMAPERLIRVYKRMQYWVEGGRSQAKPAKREEIFLDTLRSLEKSEAEFLNEIRQKKMPFKNITKEVCEAAGFNLTPQ
tara:strand:- start:766 stop:1548 length:783 start_codon:yes stop_codon:yes gene_type:complete